jgi:hypothetical protein
LASGAGFEGKVAGKPHSTCGSAFMRLEGRLRNPHHCANELEQKFMPLAALAAIQDFELWKLNCETQTHSEDWR